MARAGLDSAAVVSAAAELADADGLEGMTLARLAQRLGVRSPSLYGHVAGLADLRARVGGLGARELAAELSAAAAGRAGRDALRAVADAYRRFAHAHPGVYMAMQQPPEELAGETAEAMQHPVSVMLAVLRGYGLQGDDAFHAVRIVRSALHGFVTLENEGGFRYPLSLEDSYERLIQVLDQGLMS